MTDSFDDAVEVWIDRLERDFTEADRADEDLMRPAPSSPPGEAVGRPMSESRRPEELERRLNDQIATLSSARRELARTEQLVEMMKVISGEVRALRQEVAKVQILPAHVRSLRDDVEHVKALLTRLRELASARRQSLAPPSSPSSSSDDGPDSR